jgi:hypothetical protein
VLADSVAGASQLPLRHEVEYLARRLSLAASEETAATETQSTDCCRDECRELSSLAVLVLVGLVTKAKPKPLK